MLDKRNIPAGFLLQKLYHLRPAFIDISETDFFRLALYVVAVYSVDWQSSTMEMAREEMLSNRPSAGEELDIVGGVFLLMRLSKYGIKTKSKEQELVTALDTVLKAELEAKSRTDRIHFFDFLFYRITTQAYGVLPRHSKIVGALSASLAEKDSGLIDMFPYSGEAFIAEQQMSVGLNYCAGQFSQYEYRDVVNLRLLLRGIYPLPVSEGFHLEYGDHLTLIDCLLPSGSTQMSALSTLSTLVEKDQLTRRTLVIVGDVKNNDKLVDTLRQSLKKKNLLEVVIDFSSDDSNGKSTLVTAWLLNTQKKSEDILCIDTSKLNLLSDRRNDIEPMWFGAAIVDLWRRSDFLFRAARYSHVLGSSLKGLFKQNFDGGYKDLPGFCRVLQSRQVLSYASIIAKRHVLGESSAFSSLDSRPLLNAVLNERHSPTCSYVIGNNGIGKSMLLKDLIGTFNEHNAHSIGIAFGPVDRFPRRQKASSLFEYLGARSRDNNYSQKQSSRKLTKLLIEIYSDPGRLYVFARALHQLDVNRGLYLVAPRLQNKMHDNPLDVPEMIHLHTNAYLNEALQYETKHLDYELGLSSDRESHEVIRFSELSSGEQQVLTLLTKIVASAERSTVFLIDEPEISLHVGWQQVLPSMLSTIAKDVVCSFVIATHSPIIIANANDEIDHCFLAKDKKLTSIPVDQRHSVETILLEGFRTYTPHNREIHERCAALVSQAIRSSNQTDNPKKTSFRQMVKELRAMESIMNNTACDKTDLRFQHDLNLIGKTRAALWELFKYDREEQHV